MQARAASVRIIYQGRDISRDISPYLTSFTFTDNSGKTADDISFTLEDRKGLWLGSWFPSKGDRIECAIQISSPGSVKSMPCGLFEVDQIDYSAPPKSITVKAASTAGGRKMNGEKHTQAWENMTVSAVAAEIAGNSGLELFYDADEITFERREQKAQSDAAFLAELCKDYGLEVKISGGKLIIYSGDEYEEKAPVSEIAIDSPGLISWRFSSKAAGVYRKAVLRYHHPVKNETYESEQEDDSTEGTGRVLVIHERAESSGDAAEIAEKRLREANRGEITGSLALSGGYQFRAGVNINLAGFGYFDGAYAVSKAVHSIGSGGCTVSLELKQGAASKKKAGKKKKKAQAQPEQYYTGKNYYGNQE